MSTSTDQRPVKRPLRARISLLALSAAMLLPAAAYAQDAAAPNAAAQTDPASQSPTPGGAAGAPAGGETADERGNLLGDVVVTARRVSERLQDIPASVASIDEAQIARFSSLNDLQSAVSGVTFKSFGPITVVGIRGFGNRSNTQGPNNAVGIFQDGVFIAPFLNALESRIDVARVEVAKGPQSTLYGRSTYAGAINIVTNDPSQTTSGYIDAGVGGSSANGETLWHVRGAITGAITNTLSARAFFLQEKRQGFTYDLNTGIRGYGYNRAAGRLKLLWQPVDGISVRLAGTLMRDNSPRGEVHTDYAPPPLGGRTIFGNPFITPVFAKGPDIWSTNLTRPIEGKVHGQEVTMDTRIDTSIGELAFLTDYTHSDTSIYSYTDTSTRNVVDTPTITDEKRFSQEIRLSGKSDRLSYLAGLYYLYTNFNFSRSGTTLDLSAPFARFYPGAAPYDLAGLQAIYTPTLTKTNAYAAFGQLGYDFTDQLNLTVGVRQTRDNISGTTESNNLLRSGAIIKVVPRTYRRAQFDATTGSANLSYKIRPDVTAYASYSRGDAPGGFNNGNAAAINYLPQKVTAYELGLKSELFDRRVRLNVALFNNDYKDLQFFQAIALNGIATQVTTNAAKARGRGVDLDSTIVLSDSLRFGLQYTYQTSKITAYTIPAPPAPQVSYVGVALVRSPEHALNGSLTFSRDIGPGKFQFVAEESYSSSYNNDYQGVPAGTPYPGRPGVPAGVTTTQVLALFRTPGYAVTNLNTSYDIGRWQVSAYMRNVFNHQYIVAAASTDAFTYSLQTPGEPRTFELSLKYKF